MSGHVGAGPFRPCLSFLFISVFENIGCNVENGLGESQQSQVHEEVITVVLENGSGSLDYGSRDEEKWMNSIFRDDSFPAFAT